MKEEEEGGWRKGGREGGREGGEGGRRSREGEMEVWKGEEERGRKGEREKETQGGVKMRMGERE